MINFVIKDIFINGDKLCANMNIHMKSFELCLMDTLMTIDKVYQYRTLIHCAIVDIPEHRELYQYITLIHCAIMDIPEH